jgi:hypothetical protein
MLRNEITNSLDIELLKKLKKLTIDLDHNTTDLIGEGIKYILKK